YAQTNSEDARFDIRGEIMRQQSFLVSIAFALLATGMAFAEIKATDLRCEYRRDPLGIDITAPRLSWKIDSDARDVAQTAYRVLVASDLKQLAEEKADLWDSGRRESDQSVLVPYEGKPLSSRQQCFWKVMVWDKSGAASE